METFLCCFVSACPNRWVEWIYLVEFWYNSSCHSALGFSPFEVLYGYAPKHFGIETLSACPVPSLDEWLQDKAVMTDLVQQHLSRAQLRMKHQADKNHSEYSFEVGDMVYLKLRPYVQSSLAPRANQKLAFRYFGPFKILSKIGIIAYKLELPATPAIHPIFHVSQLKSASAPSEEVAHLPAHLDGLQFSERVLRRRMSSDGVSQVFIKWSGMPRSLATWEDLTPLRQRFPHAPA